MNFKVRSQRWFGLLDAVCSLCTVTEVYRTFNMFISKLIQVLFKKLGIVSGMVIIDRYAHANSVLVLFQWVEFGNSVVVILSGSRGMS